MAESTNTKAVKEQVPTPVQCLDCLIEYVKSKYNENKNYHNMTITINKNGADLRLVDKNKRIVSGANGEVVIHNFELFLEQGAMTHGASELSQ